MSIIITVEKTKATIADDVCVEKIPYNCPFTQYVGDWFYVRPRLEEGLIYPNLVPLIRFNIRTEEVEHQMWKCDQAMRPIYCDMDVNFKLK